MSELARIVKFGKRFFREGDLYKLEQLPKEPAQDAETQLSNAGIRPEDMSYRFKFLTPQELERMLTEEFGPDLPGMLESDHVNKLVRSIEKHGLRSPPVGREGFHRMMAFLLIGEDLPYFEIETHGGGVFWGGDTED